MRNFYLLLLGLIWSFNALAALNSTEQTYADMLLSGDNRQLLNAAKGISQQGLSNTELIDIMAEILLNNYQDAYNSEIDMLAWLARAIGASENGRYHSVLSEVLTSSDHKKLRRHADTALDDLGKAEGEQYVAGMYKLPEGLYAKESEEDRDKRIMDLLLIGDLVSLKLVARTIIDTNSQNQQITDFLAEILITNHADAEDDQIETFSWVAKALGQSKTGRYAHILSEVEDKGAHRKLRKYAKASLKIHGKAIGEQYKKGMLGEDIASYEH